MHRRWHLFFLRSDFAWLWHGIDGVAAWSNDRLAARLGGVATQVCNATI